MSERKKSKRGQNEGGCYQRKDGRWEASLTLPADMGAVTRRRSFYGKTKAEAMRKLRKAMSELESGRMPTPDKLTVAAYLDKWLEDSTKPKVRPRTYQSYE